jgi:hypothetical protein
LPDVNLQAQAKPRKLSQKGDAHMSGLKIGETRTAVVAGIISGQIAGLIMAVVVMFVFAVFLGKSPLYPVQVIGSIAFGEAALQGVNFPALLTGLVIHQLGPSLVWGIVFGLIAAYMKIHAYQAALILGLILGAITMVDAYILVPTAMKALQGVDIWNREVPMTWDWAAHLVFGASFVFYPWVMRRIAS